MSGEYVERPRRTDRDCSRFDKVRFINLVRKHEALYNHNHGQFGVKSYIDSIYKKIAIEVGLKGIDAARNKWKSIKICYRFHKLKYANPSMNAQKPMKKWPYFEMLQFLDKYVAKYNKNRRMGRNVSPPPEPPSLTSCSSYPSDCSIHHTCSDADLQPAAEPQSNNLYIKSEPTYEVDHHYRSNVNNHREQVQWSSETIGLRDASRPTSSIVHGGGGDINSSTSTEIVTGVRENGRGAQTAITTTASLLLADQDENAQYGKFIASRIRKLTAPQKHQVRKGIEDVFYEIESECQHEAPTD